jgi:hypothetical protein
MFGRGASKYGAGLIAAALVATMASGITYAATASGGATACVNKAGVLALVGKHGKCSRGYTKTKLGARGARGLQGAKGPKGDPGIAGPGAQASVAETPSTAEVAGRQLTVDGIEVKAVCNDSSITGLDPPAAIELSTASSYKVRGLVFDVSAGPDSDSVAAAGTFSSDYTDFTSGSQEVNYDATGTTVLYASDAGNHTPLAGASEALNADLLVTIGTSVVSINAYIVQDATPNCEAFAQAVPS